nr:helix-turn-helix transcriptional regulator [Streptomyces sp. S1D4-11]
MCARPHDCSAGSATPRGLPRTGTVRLEDLDKICAALGCTVADLLEAEPVTGASGQEGGEQAVGGAAGPVRPVPCRDGPRRLRPPN